MRRALLVAAFAIALGTMLALELVAAAQPSAQVAIALTDFKVSMGPATIPAGVPVKFTASNQGQMMHEVVLERAGAVDQPFEVNGRETEIEDIAPGQTKSATWTITQPGEYQLACHVPGHFEAGMVQQFTVFAAAGGQPGAPMQLAASQPEDQAEHATGPAAAVSIIPATLPVTGGPVGPSPLWFVAGAAVGLIAAIIAAFRLIVGQIRGQD